MVLVGLLTTKFSFHSPSHAAPCGRKSLGAAHTHQRTWDCCSVSLRVSTQIFQNSFAWKICPFAPIYLFIAINHLYHYGSTHFVPWIITQYHFTSGVAQIAATWPLGVLSMGSHVPLTYLYHWGWVCFVFFGALPYFLAIEGMPQTHDIYISCSSLKISHFSKDPYFLSSENGKTRSEH